MASIGAIFTSTYYTKQLNPWPNSSTSCVVNHSRVSACQREMESFEGDPSIPDVQQALETSHRKISLGNFQHHYLTEWLVNVYSYHLMVKSVSCCCVCVEASFSQIQSHIRRQVGGVVEIEVGWWVRISSRMTWGRL